MKIDEARSKLANTVASALHAAFGHILSEDKRFAIPEAIHFGLNTSLAAMVATVPFLANRPHLEKKEINERGTDELLKLINYETLLFAALISARMHGEVRVDGEPERTKLGDEMGTSIGISQSVEFGPDILALAIEDWKKLTEKDPMKFIDNGLLRSVEAMSKAASTPFDEFLQNRLKAQGPTPSSGTLQ